MRQRQMMAGALAVAGWLGLAAAATAAPVVLDAQGRQIQGTAIRSHEDGRIELATPQGVRTFQPGEYRLAVADRPELFDQAETFRQANQMPSAIRAYTQVIEQYAFLTWDIEASRRLAGIQNQAGRPGEAARTLEKILDRADHFGQRNQLHSEYLRYLAALQERGELAEFGPRGLGALARAGDPPVAARALVLRGDLRVAAGQHDEAVLDFLRVATLYRQAREIQAEALFKAGQSFDELRDPSAARQMYRRLRENFPQSPFAARIP